MNKWIFTPILILPFLIIQPAFASIIIFEQSNLEIQQGEEKILSFSILGEKKELAIGEPNNLPAGLTLSIIEDEVSSISGLIQVSVEKDSLPGETMIKLLHGDEVYFLNITVLPKQAELYFYFIALAIALFLIILVATKTHLPPIKSFHLFQKTHLSLIILIIISTITIIPAFGISSTLNITVTDENNSIIERATVVLFDPDYNYLFSMDTDSNGIASFVNLEEDSYIYEVYFQKPNLQGEFWGSGIIILEKNIVEFVFTRTTPKIINVNSSYIDEQSKIIIASSILNPGPYETNIIVNLLLDRDQSTPFDETKKSGIITIAPNSIETYEFNVDLNEAGAYYSSIYLSLSNSEKTITDQTPWSNAANISGSISIKAKDTEKETQTSFFLFDTSYNLIDHKSAKESNIIQWNNLFPTNYIIETYHKPSTSLDLIEFWGAITTQISENTIDFKQMSPNIENIKLNKDGDLQIVTVTVVNQEGYAKQVKVSIIIDSDKKLPFDGFQESDTTILDSDEEMKFAFSINNNIFSKGQIYVLVQTVYNNNFIITDQIDWIKLK